MVKKAWEIDRSLRQAAMPVDRRLVHRNYKENITIGHLEDNLLSTYWGSEVPGSGAPDIAYVSMVQAMYNKGFEVSAAERILHEALPLVKDQDQTALANKTQELISTLFESTIDPGHPYHKFEHPASWEDIQQAMHPNASSARQTVDQPTLAERIYQGWIGQLAGGSFGTALEGYSGDAITKVYGTITDYVDKPETTNDDVVYELVFLEVFKRKGRGLTSRDLAEEWVKQIPFGWSAEGVALENIRNGIWPPESGSYRNAYSDWLGVQMRTMIEGMLSPGWPMEAARLAVIDGVVSHAANGVYGGIYAAVLTSLAFVFDDPRALLEAGSYYLPQKSEYAHVVQYCLETVSKNDPVQAWKSMDSHFETYNWIHAYPNIAAVILALWHSENDMTKAFSLLARAGMDVDCNGGLVGNILGIMRAVPAKWAKPISQDDLLETYLPGSPRVSIKALADQTYRAINMES